MHSGTVTITRYRLDGAGNRVVIWGQNELATSTVTARIGERA